jgi:GNAT acetyltransferase-like protein
LDLQRNLFRIPLHLVRREYETAMSEIEMSSLTTQRLARALPDTPRWVDTRGMLLSGRAEVFAADALEAAFVVRVLSGALAAVSVVGRPSEHAIHKAVDGTTDMTPVLAQLDNAGYVGDALATCPASLAGQTWTPEHAIVHRLSDTAVPRLADGAPIRLLGAEEPLDHLPAGLRFEIGHARMIVPVAVAVVDGMPVSFCYPCWTTETLWDVSIDTLDGYRRRGLAARTAQFMMDLMRRHRREPVWAAMQSNVVSLQLARRLGFAAVDEIVVFSRGSWAYFTRGFGEEVRQ